MHRSTSEPSQLADDSSKRSLLTAGASTPTGSKRALLLTTTSIAVASNPQRPMRASTGRAVVSVAALSDSTLARCALSIDSYWCEYEAPGCGHAIALPSVCTSAGAHSRQSPESSAAWLSFSKSCHAARSAPSPRPNAPRRQSRMASSTFAAPVPAALTSRSASVRFNCTGCDSFRIAATHASALMGGTSVAPSMRSRSSGVQPSRRLAHAVRSAATSVKPASALESPSSAASSRLSAPSSESTRSRARRGQSTSAVRATVRRALLVFSRCGGE
eukprot:scaffold87938_cov66-Phaeocystis_antarctica.AAC.4